MNNSCLKRLSFEKEDEIVGIPIFLIKESAAIKKQLGSS